MALICGGKEAICGPAMRSYHPPSLRAHRGRSEVALRRDMNIGPSLSVMALLGEIGGSCGELVLPLIISPNTKSVLNYMQSPVPR